MPGDLHPNMHTLAFFSVEYLLLQKEAGNGTERGYFFFPSTQFFPFTMQEPQICRGRVVVVREVSQEVRQCKFEVVMVVVVGGGEG